MEENIQYYDSALHAMQKISKKTGMKYMKGLLQYLKDQFMEDDFGNEMMLQNGSWRC
jgi:hypothetical protein